jgi:putative endonuclease
VSKAHILGKSGEAGAIRTLEENGYRILETNYRNKLGEIDIIACERDTICFVEVKTRSSLVKGFPQESVSPEKQRRISRTALSYLKEKGLLKRKSRFDIVSIVDTQDQQKADLIKDAFALSPHYSY